MKLYEHLFSSDMALFVGSLIICALLAFIETSITALRLFKLKELELSNKKYKNIFKILENNPKYILISILIATNLASVTCAVVSQQLLEHTFESIDVPEGVAFSIGIAITTIIVSIFGEIIPKSLAQSQDSKKITSTLWIVNLIYIIFSPFVKAFMKLSRLFSKNNEENNHKVSEKELHFLISYIEEQGIMENEKTFMLQNIFRMGRTYVKEILIPQNEIISVNLLDDVSVLLEKFKEHQFSRFPVYQDNPENIIGIVYQKDLFFATQINSNVELKDLIRPIIFVPDNLKVNELLKEFKKQHIHMAMVLDEYGSTIGLVTLEDALEEIVGDIHDEHDDDLEDSQKIKIIQEGSEWSVDATIDLDRLKEYLKITLSSSASVTLGGFITEHLQHLPKKGEQFFYKGYCFTIEKSNKKRVVQVHIKTAEECKPPAKSKKKKS